MAQGFQIFDSTGNLVLDVSDFTLKLFATISITNPVNGSQVVSALIGQTNVFTIFNPDVVGTADPTISVNTTTGTVSWTYDPTALAAGASACSTGSIVYGVN